jgi:uncharacterized protein YggL (DUF469 family)
MTNVERLTKFIEDNKLDFDASGSSLNSAFVTLSGYSLFTGANEEEVRNVLEATESLTSMELKEFDRVYDYSKKNNYGEWWKKEEAKKMYKF